MRPPLEFRSKAVSKTAKSVPKPAKWTRDQFWAALADLRLTGKELGIAIQTRSLARQRDYNREFMRERRAKQ